MGLAGAVVALVLLVGPARPAPAQDRPERTVLARFQEAAALDVDPSGRLYVADAGRDVIRILDQEGTVRATLGQSGTRAGEFDDPVDLDPTNGQTLLVADADNGRVQRFSAELQYLEALAVGRAFGGVGGRRVFDDGRDGSAVQGDGRPIAVASSNGNDTYVVNERDNAVVKFDAQRRAERVIGPSTNGAGALRAPVDLALDANHRLYVADRERNAVLAFDQFGTFVRQIPTPSLPTLQAVSVRGGTLWMVCAGRIVAWNPSTESTTEHGVEVDAPLVDAAWQDGTLFLLTERRLLSREAG